MIVYQIFALLGVAVCFGWFIYNRRQPQPTWDILIQDTTATRLDLIEHLYDEMVVRIQKVRPDMIKQSYWSRRLYIHPGPTLPYPYQNKWAVSFPEHTDGGNAGGNIVVLDRFKDNEELFRHEVCHLITGITDHPSWLFGAGLKLNV